MKLGHTLIGLNQWPEGETVWRAVLEKYYGEVFELGQRILSAFAIALDMPPDFFRALILWRDDVGGPQVKNRAGKWIDAPCIEDTFVINIGDMLQLWSNHLRRAMGEVLQTKGEGKIVWSQHEDIFDALAEGNAEQAGRMAEAHVQSAVGRVLSVVEAHAKAFHE